MTEPMKTALDLAKSLPCQCSDCGMNEPASGEMIEIYVTERVAAERDRIKELMGELIKVAELRYESYKESEDVIERAKKLIDSHDRTNEMG